MSSQPSGSTTTISASGQASAIPAASPPPPHGTTIRGGERAELLEDLEPDRALPGDDRRIVEARHDRRAASPRRCRAAIASRLSVRAVVEDDLRAFGARAVDLHPGASAGMTIVAANAEPPRRDRHAARMIARREGDHAALPLLGDQLQQPVGRAAQLERAAGLQAFAFQPDARAVDLGFRSAAFARPVPAIRCRGRQHVFASDFSASIKLLDNPILSIEPLQHRRQNAPQIPSRVQKIFTRGTPAHISRPAAPWDFQPQGSSCRRTTPLEVP